MLEDGLVDVIAIAAVAFLVEAFREVVEGVADRDFDGGRARA